MHGVIRPGDIVDSRTTTLAETAHVNGYSTGAFSANPYVRDDTGLTRGFDAHSTGQFLDGLLRWPTRTGRPDPMIKRGKNRTSTAAVRSLPEWLKNRLRFMVSAHPSLIDLPVRLASNVIGGLDPADPICCRWLEPRIRSWLGSIPDQKPAFCFVNLMDAHEPYIGVRPVIQGSEPTLREIWRSLAWGMGAEESESHLGGEVLRVLGELYLGSIEIVDRRFSSILRSFRTIRGGDNLVILFLADHGQTIGEAGTHFHRYGESDSLMRIPLILHLPRDVQAGTQVERWISATEVTAAIKGLMQGQLRSIADLTSESTVRASPAVWGLTESIPEPSESSLRAPNGPRVSNLQLVGYSELGKVLIPVPRGPDHPILPTRIESAGDLSKQVAPVQPELREGFEAARVLMHRLQGSVQSTVETRLLGWGY